MISYYSNIFGAAWIVRNSNGQVLLHSRRFYSQVHSLFDAKVKSWEWALDNMKKHHLEKLLLELLLQILFKRLQNQKIGQLL